MEIKKNRDSSILQHCAHGSLFEGHEVNSGGPAVGINAYKMIETSLRVGLACVDGIFDDPEANWNTDLNNHQHGILRSGSSEFVLS